MSARVRLSVTPDVRLSLSAVVVPGAGDYGTYAGPTEVAPTREPQSLPTAGLLMGDDVTVGGIPAEYVSERYVGDASVTPAESAQTLACAGLVMPCDVVVAAIPAGYADVSADTVAADTLVEGATAHMADGSAVTGTAKPSPEWDGRPLLLRGQMGYSYTYANWESYCKPTYTGSWSAALEGRAARGDYIWFDVRATDLGRKVTIVQTLNGEQADSLAQPLRGVGILDHVAERDEVARWLLAEQGVEVSSWVTPDPRA